MITTLFGELGFGRLSRRLYLFYSLGMAAALMVMAIVLSLAIGAAETMIAGDLTATQTLMGERLGGGYSIALAALFTVVLFVYLNLMAKRLRDIGLPGWGGVIMISALTVAISITSSPGLANTLAGPIWLVLVLVPTAMIKRRTTA